MTGVQTCALPISTMLGVSWGAAFWNTPLKDDEQKTTDKTDGQQTQQNKHAYRIYKQSGTGVFYLGLLLRAAMAAGTRLLP